ncbi:MFS transporter [Alicyclobacillus fastidiosus]|uniref:MFS transporter n=1 Tax=Alicyclobacillus fastidiosus TaxID=392011 RepID=A0ABV5AC47_9BACL|nr:MFS transporter [Alicyclobacillus fastidiosus]WEH07654.1 MFS transporter [Alicyclobacillus fastidiosus]
MNADASIRTAQWKWTFLASMANYIDAGSIVAGAAGLSLWQTYFHMSTTWVGLLAAFSSNGISAGVGALLGGRICDLFGRKRIYSWDLLVYAFGLLWIICAVAPWMLVVGYVIVGLAVGADIPASWTIIAELAPSQSRGKHSGMAIILWNTGPIVCLLMAFALSSLGVLGTRLVFIQLFVVAIVTWMMRRGMVESSRWKEATRQERSLAGRGESQSLSVYGFRSFFKRPHFGALVFCIGFFGIWNLEAGTNGFFFPYILKTVGSQTQSTSVLMQSLGFLLGLVSTACFFMPLNDRVNRRWLFAIGGVLQIVGMMLFAVFPLTILVAFGYVLLNNVGGGVGQRPFFQVWSAELFPTKLRSTAQGLAYGLVRIGVGLWSFFVPVLTATGFHVLAWMLTGFLLVSACIGVIWAPDTRGKSLEQIAVERGYDTDLQVGQPS